KAEDGTPVTCSPRAYYGDHQLWALERVSRTSQEIRSLIKSWKSELLPNLVQPFADDV
ncbi:hypothetical protein FRC01_003728, partial [Tulasnella sp. 417]